MREPAAEPSVVVGDSDAPATAIRTDSLGRDYAVGDSVVHALRDVSITIAPQQLVAIHGRSGSGKTTLLNLLGGLDEPTTGQVWVEGREVTAMTRVELLALRRHTLGFVFQSFGLIPILSAAENIGVPLRLTRTDPSERAERVSRLLELVGLSGRADLRPNELSGGEQQRVAIARALAGSPRLLLADEPTGQLDSATGRRIMTLLHDLLATQGITVVVTTHDPDLIELADRVLEIADGEIVADSG
ncbi:MAG: ABC transporter ATP-binding protein [Mycobacteriales bacterium]